MGETLGLRWHLINACYQAYFACCRAYFRWHPYNVYYWIVDRVYFPLAESGWRAIHWGLGWIWTFKRWRELGKPKMNYAKRIINLDRFCKYKSIDADVYIGFGASNFTAELVSFCKAANKPIIILTASDSDLSEDYFKRSGKRNEYGDLGDNCWFVIRSADRLVAQTPGQGERAWKIFRRPSTVIRNPIDLSVQRDPHRDRETRRHVAWIGKADDVKQPGLFVELARRFPDTPFRLVMNRNQKEVEDRVLADLPDNVMWSEQIKRPEIPGFFEDAIALVNTSRFEGFPNAFIEACRAGTPLLALNVDPGGILTKEGCGLYAGGDFEMLVSHLRTMLDDNTTWRHHHERALAYVARDHDQGACVDKLIEEIETLYQGPLLRPFPETPPSENASAQSPAPSYLRRRA